MCYTRGGLQLWRATYDAGKAINRQNVASQDFNPKGRTALNKAEYLGGSVYVTASGTYDPVVSCVCTLLIRLRVLGEVLVHRVCGGGYIV